MIRAVADTHAILWYLYNDARLSATAGAMMDKTFLEGDEIVISSLTLVEIVYLVEKKRIQHDAFEVVTNVLSLPHSHLREQPVTAEIAETMRLIDRKQIPEMPDRIIAATALWLGVPVISRDHKITASAIKTIW